jgi:hypothetical protein
MFVIACGFNIPRVEDSRIRKFLSPRRKDAKFGKETIGLLRKSIALLIDGADGELGLFWVHQLMDEQDNGELCR